MPRDGWTPLQIAWADHAAAETAYEVALAAVDEADSDVEWWSAEASGDPDLEVVRDARERLATARKTQERAVAAIPPAEAALRDAERAYWAQVRWGRRQAADHAGISPDTWSGYVTRGQAPKSDGHDETGHPWWSELTVRNWTANRPGQGARRDRSTA